MVAAIISHGKIPILKTTAFVRGDDRGGVRERSRAPPQERRDDQQVEQGPPHEGGDAPLLRGVRADQRQMLPRASHIRTGSPANQSALELGDAAEGVGHADLEAEQPHGPRRSRRDSASETRAAGGLGVEENARSVGTKTSGVEIRAIR